MRIMFLHHSARHARPAHDAHVPSLLKGYACPITTIGVHYPDDLGAGEVLLQLLEQRRTLSGLHHILETPALVKKIIEAKRSRFDAVVRSNIFDPGVAAARLTARIPVVGPLRSPVYFVGRLCDRFGFLVPRASHVSYEFRLVEGSRVGHFVTAIKALDVYESDKSKQPSTIVERPVSLGRQMVAAGAQAVIPLGGLFFPYQKSIRRMSRTRSLSRSSIQRRWGSSSPS